MTKTTKHSTKPNRRATVVADYYDDIYTCRQMPITDTFFERLAQEYTQWARDNKDVYVLDQFAIDKGIPRYSFQRWCKSKPILKKAHQEVKNIIAVRRETRMLQGVIKEKSNMYMMHRYHQDWEEADKRWSELNAKAQEKEQGGNINVVIQAAENTDVPPMRKNVDVIADQEDKDEE